MARAIPGSAEILAIYGHRPRNQMEFAKREERPHPLATLETVVQSPLMDLAVAGISRGMDEYDYSQRVKAEKSRVEAANQGRNEELGAIRAEREELQSKLGAIPPQYIENAVNAGQAGFTSPAPPGVEYLENVGPAAYPIGQIGSESRDVTGSPHGDFQRQVPVMGMAQPKPSGWGNYTYEQIQQMLSDQKRLEEAESKVAPAVEGRFIPRTQEEFIIAIQSEKDPARRLELIQQARSAVDMQPTSLLEAAGGVKGRETQAAVHKAQQDADKAEAAASAAEVEAKLAERDMRVKEKDEASKSAKRRAETDKLDAEADKLAKDIEKIARRAKANSQLGRDTQTLLELTSNYPGETLPERLKNAFGSGKKFQDEVKKAIPKTYPRVYQKVFGKHKNLMKSGKEGGDNEAKIAVRRKSQINALSERSGAEETIRLLGGRDAELSDVAAAQEMRKAKVAVAKANEVIRRTGDDIKRLANKPEVTDVKEVQ